MRPGLTSQQQHVLDYLRAYFAANDSLPSSKTIASAFGHASPNAASEILLKLAAKGYIEKNEAGGYRFSRQSLMSASVVKAAMVRAARYLAPTIGADAVIDGDEADAIANTLRIAAQRIPQT